jgi:hypothetical protein
MRSCLRHEISLFAIIAPWKQAQASIDKGENRAGVPDKKSRQTCSGAALAPLIQETDQCFFACP